MGRISLACDWTLRHLWVPIGACFLTLFALGAPEYLCWPWWADHDVFATMARGWAQGERPYRDIVGNNFPGAIYMFWAVGTLAGWGRTWAFYMLDLAIFAGFVATLIAWGRRMSSSWLPGLAGALILLLKYTSYDVVLVAQRDWHACLLSMAGLLAMQAWPGRSSRLAGAACLALALSIRPHALLFAPAYLAVLAYRTGQPYRRRLFDVLEFGLAGGALVFLLFLPVVVQGLIGPLLRGLRLVTGSNYSELTPHEFVERLRGLSRTYRLRIVVGMALLVAGQVLGATTSRVWLPWLVATLFAFLSPSLSPQMHAYAIIYIEVLLVVDASLLTVMILRLRRPTPARLVGFVALFVCFTSPWARPLVDPRATLRSLGSLARGTYPSISPLGYPPFDTAHKFPYYDWLDYQAMLDYLRTSTDPSTRVANVIVAMPVTGPAARLPAFPAESITWMFMVDPKAESEFIRSLEARPNSVVVWAPRETRRNFLPKVPRLEASIRAHYEPDRRFGLIEVWRRKPGT